MDVIRGPAYGGDGKPATMPEADGGRVDAAAAWRNAIDGKSNGPVGYDTVAAAKTWMSQPFVSDEERARKEALKAIVRPAQIEAAAVLATGVSANERQAASDAALIAKVTKAFAAAQTAAQATIDAEQAPRAKPETIVAQEADAPVVKKTKRAWGIR